MFNFLLDIKHFHLEGTVARFPALFFAAAIAQSGVNAFWLKKSASRILFYAAVVMAALTIGFVAAVEEIPNVTLSLSVAAACLVSFYFVFLVLAVVGRRYRPTLIWWTKFSLVYASAVLTLLGVSLFTKLLRSGLVCCEVACFAWFGTYIAFTYSNGMVPRCFK